MPSATRRNFLQGLVGTGLIAMTGSALLSEGAMASGPALSGRLVAVGFGAKRFSTQPGSGNSVITELNLASGEVRRSFIKLAAAHTLMALPKGFGLCLPLDGPVAGWIDAKLALEGSLEAPQGYLFSGHGLVNAQGSHAFVSLRLKDARSFADHGRIGVIDLSTRKLVAALDSGGVRPHDMVWQAETLLISHYGDINYEQAGPSAGNRRAPCLVELDTRSGRIRNTIHTPAEGSLTHLAADPNGRICAVPLNYYGFDEAGKRSVEAGLSGQAFEISVAEELEGRLAAPMPILMIDRHTASVKALKGNPSEQRRAQSVTYHPGSGRFFVTYSFSDTLAAVDAEVIRYVSGFDLGLSYVRGVCPIAKTDWLAVTGEFRGLALIHAKTLEVVKRIDVAWYDHAHVYHWA